MCSDFKLIDTVNLQNRLNVIHAIDSSQDDCYAIVVEDGLYVFQLCGFMKNILTCMSLKKNFIKLENFILSSHLGTSINSFVHDLPQFDLYEAALRLDISEELNQSTPIKQLPILAKWSPTNLINNSRCPVALLTNTGSLNIFVYTLNESEIENFVSIANVSKFCVDYYSKKYSWVDISMYQPEDKFEEIKKRSTQVTPTCFTWSNVIINEGIQFCLFIVGHLGGVITTLVFNSRTPNDITQLETSNIIGYFDTGMKRITSMHWQYSGSKGLLLVGDLEGRAKAIIVSNISSKSVSFEDEMFLWKEKDNIKVEQFKVLIYNKMMYILIVKGSFLIICLINETGNIADVYHYHAGNLQITGIELFEENRFLLLTYTGVLKEIKLSCENDKIIVKWRILYLDFKWSSCCAHGLMLSRNRVFIGILVRMSKLKDIKKMKDPVRLLIFMNMNKDPLAVLMKNNTNSLAQYWDCLELLRIDGLLERKLPCDGLPVGLDYDRLSLTKLKTCLWLAKSSEMMYDKMYSIEDYNILRYEEFHFIVKIKLVLHHVQFLLKLLTDDTELSEFHMQSLDILNMYLKEVVVSDTLPKLGLGKNIIDELFDTISLLNEFKYPPPPKCLWCQENIIGLSCLPPHVDTRCNISYMPITKLPYYKCQFCESIVHGELKKIYKTLACPYCDNPMALVSFITDLKKDNLNVDDKFNANIGWSCCSSDCTKETENIEEIEEHAFTKIKSKINFIWLSSDEEIEDDVDNNEQAIVSFGQVCKDNVTTTTNTTESTSNK